MSGPNEVDRPDTIGTDRVGRAPGGASLRGWSIAGAIGAVTALMLPPSLGWAVRGVGGWDLALVVLLGLPWRMMLRSDPDQSRQRAVSTDPGGFGVFLISLVASFVSLAATIVTLRRPGAFAPEPVTGLLVVLGVVAVIGAWILMHTAFALHYARLYYAVDAPGGLAFAGGPPDDLDFAYFAFGIGTAYEVSDVTVSSRPIRRFVLIHSVLSFVYNTAILALLINLLAGEL